MQRKRLKEIKKLNKTAEQNEFWFIWDGEKYIQPIVKNTGCYIKTDREIIKIR